MPRIFFQFFLFFVLAAFVALLSGCSAEAKLASGVKIYRTGEYAQSIQKFDKMDFDNRYYRSQASFYQGMSYGNLGQGARASASFQRAVRYGFTDPVASFYLAQSLRMREEYEEAIVAYEEYLNHDVGNRAALNGIRSCQMALNSPDNTSYEVEPMRRLSSRFGDYSPAFAGEDYTTIYFSSMRGEDKKRLTNRITGQGSSVIYSSLQDGRGGWEDPVPFVGSENPDADDGASAFSQDGKEMYFTRCTYPQDAPMGASIFVKKRSGGRWGEPEPINLGPDSLVFAHPAISPDGQTLYFVSDMAGGFGGKDLWKVTRSQSEWGAPENLGADINTPADEMFPYVRTDGRLYFSSDGLVGYGGLDIFEARFVGDEDGWEVKNMGLPVNSSGNDFGIVFRGKRNTGFLTSSRNSYRGVDDLFEFELPVIQAVLVGVVTGADGEAIADAAVQVIGNNGTNLTASSSEKGRFNFILEPGADYVVMISSAGYYNEKITLSTHDMEESEDIKKNIVLQRVSSE
jgi:peptidoglycan-associated lipoprotein